MANGVRILPGFRVSIVAVTALAAALMVATFAGSISAADCGSTASAGIDWGGCNKKNLMLEGGDFQKGNLADTDFTLTNLSDSNLASANLEKATLVRTWFTGSDLTKANFSKVEAYRSGFEGVNAEGANFTGAELQRANFNRAVLKGVNFEKAELGRVTFKGADVTGVNFALTNLSRADLTGATFTGPISFDRAFMFLTRISGLDLSQATGLDAAQVALACGDSNTKLPSGMATPTSWPCEAD